MDATARLRVALDARGRTVPTELRAEAPLLMRVTDEDVGCGLTVHLVGGAAGPLAGDRLVFGLDLESGARLTVRSVAASLAQPGRAGANGSTAAVSARVHAGAALDWWPEPVISVSGSSHTITTAVDIAGDAHVRWVDEAVLGRHREVGGRLTLHQRISIGGAPVLRHTVTLDPRHAGVGRHGHVRVVVTAIVTGPTAVPAASIVSPDLRCVRAPLGETCTAWIALADDLDRARAALADLGLDRSGPVARGLRGVDQSETST
ncbi:MAG: urease accessory protein UreD [Acidimicrobiales bacterium]|nr:urease accessory protein UreD [Acidimicrobiales bacterium]